MRRQKLIYTCQLFQQISLNTCDNLGPNNQNHRSEKEKESLRVTYSGRHERQKADNGKQVGFLQAHCLKSEI
jgi:hypothetical protein